MKITILNGNPNPDNQVFDSYLARLEATLQSQGHSVTNLELRTLHLTYCTGCFGCWIKSPGECRSADDGPLMRRAVIHADLALLASPVIMGFPSALLKKTVEKFLPLLHPYVTIVENEFHHQARYAHYPDFGLLLEKTPGTDDEDLEIIRNIFSRTALNFKCRLRFTHLTSQPLEEVCHAANNL
jgi:hypothetical protein